MLQLRSSLQYRQEPDGGALLFDEKTGAVYVLNQTGSSLVQGLLNGKDSEELTQLLSQEYEVTETDARTDVQIFLKELSAQGFVTASEGVTP